MLGDRGVAVTLDDMDLDVARRHVGEAHIARRPGAEKNDVLERGAPVDQRRRHIGMIVDADVVAGQHARQLVRRERLAVDVDRRIAGAKDPLPDRRQLIVAIEEERPHFPLPIPPPPR